MQPTPSVATKAWTASHPSANQRWPCRIHAARLRETLLWYPEPSGEIRRASRSQCLRYGTYCRVGGILDSWLSRQRLLPVSQNDSQIGSRVIQSRPTLLVNG